MIQLVEKQIGTERALDLGYLVLVASQTTDGAWYEVREGRCTCKGYEMRGICRHLAVAALAQRPAIITPEPKPAARVLPFGLDDDDYYSSARIAQRAAMKQGVVS